MTEQTECPKCTEALNIRVDVIKIEADKMVSVGQCLTCECDWVEWNTSTGRTVRLKENK